MATVAEIDEKIEEAKRKVAQLEERRKATLAKERELARKWRAATLAAIGETVLATAGCDWTQLDLESLKSWLDVNADEVRSLLLTDERPPAQAKKSLDAFKRKKPARGQEPPAQMPGLEGEGACQPEERGDWQ